MNKIVKFLKDFFLEEYEVSIWYEDPVKVTTYRLKTIQKLTSNTLKGKDMNGFSVELVVQNPFNYQVKKIH
jgi:hypothetical protein